KSSPLDGLDPADLDAGHGHSRVGSERRRRRDQRLQSVGMAQRRQPATGAQQEEQPTDGEDGHGRRRGQVPAKAGDRTPHQRSSSGPGGLPPSVVPGVHAWWKYARGSLATPLDVMLYSALPRATPPRKSENLASEASHWKKPWIGRLQPATSLVTWSNVS